MLASHRLRCRVAPLAVAGLLAFLLVRMVSTASALGPARGDDPTRPLMVAPELAFATYIGGRGEEISRGIAVDPAGYIYVTGSTTAPDLAADRLLRPPQSGDVTDAFVAKLSPDGREVVYMTYLGGHGIDQGLAIAVDASGHAYVTGRTSSADLPTVGAFQPSLAGEFDAFVAKLSPDGAQLVYSTYLGGSGYDDGLGIATDTAGYAYVTGLTRSRNFPTMGALQPVLGGFTDAFVAKLDPVGGALTYATYLGGSDVDNGLAIALDACGEAYVTGRTRSTDFPRVRAIQSMFAGSFDDAFVAKLTADGSALIFATYLGGSGEDDGRSIAVDASGYAYVTGLTRSTDFPTMRPLQSARSEGIDAFVAKLSPDGTELMYSTYLGGGAHDDGLGIAADKAGRAYVTGSTASSNFPTRGPVQPTHAGGFSDAFLAVISADGSTILSASYLGGIGFDNGFGVAIDGRGNAHITGLTRSNDFATIHSLRPPLAGPSDAFVAKVLVPDGLASVSGLADAPCSSED